MNNTALTRVPGPQGPDFVGVGVHKAGTSWLAKMIAQHPRLFINKKDNQLFRPFFSQRVPVVSQLL